MMSKPVFESDWREAKREIEAEIDRIWLDEPEEIQKIRWGVIESGAGSGGQSFSVLVHLEAYLMLGGADILYRFLKVSQLPHVDVRGVVDMTREFMINTFNIFEFLEDLGLAGMHAVGQKYSAALDTVKTKDEYVELTGSVLTLITRMHRWIHFIFPWNLGVAFPHRSIAEIEQISALVASRVSRE